MVASFGAMASEIFRCKGWASQGVATKVQQHMPARLALKGQKLAPSGQMLFGELSRRTAYMFFELMTES